MIVETPGILTTAGTKALQSLLLDPVITDMDVARQILDDYLTTYKEYLPQFWKEKVILA